MRRSIVYPRKSQLWDSIFKHKRDTSNSLDHLNHVTENREHAAQREKEIKGRVHGLVLMLDQRVPLDELAKLIFELEQADIHDLELIQAAKSKLVRARDAQEKRRQQELKAERERLYKAAVLELKQQLTLEPLDVDVDALRHQLDIGKTIDMQSKDEELFAKATDKLHLAARLQQEVRDAKKRQAEAELKLQTMLTATLGLPALTEALSDGQRVEASKVLSFVVKPSPRPSPHLCLPSPPSLSPPSPSLPLSSLLYPPSTIKPSARVQPCVGCCQPSAASALPIFIPQPGRRGDYLSHT